MTARDDYPEMAVWAAAASTGRANNLEAEMIHALDEIDELHSTIEELSMLLYEATYHS